ncbi:MAG: YaeQ family protein [Gammaproteobacteria bacterium]|nr:YaeQ family protein [Gammaproteobacteria bacterium]
MALKATVYRVELDISDIDRGIYTTHSLTLARHPSETEERLMARLLAFALYSDPALEFCRGISTEDEPDLWLKDDTGAILRWIEVGLPDERRLRRAAGRADSVVVLGYGGRAVDVWWAKNAGLLERLPRFTMLALPFEAGRELALLANRSMHLQCTIQERQLYFSDSARSVLVEPQVLREN